MAHSHLMTDWICIATEGETVDGRNIEGQWLYDMAESYDPENIYSAQIWPEHERWYSAYGEVLALKCEEVDGEAKLFARLRPEIHLLEANRNGQLLFCSIEPTPTLNFRGTGKPYLEGLGVTSQPASIGTTRMRFSAEKSGRIFGGLEPLVFNRVTELSEDEMSDKKISDKKRMFRSLFNLPDKSPGKEKDNEPENRPEKTKKGLFSKMKFSDEQVEAIVEVVEELITDAEEQAEAIEEVKEQLTEIAEVIEEIKGEVSGEEFSRLKKQLKDAESKFSKLDAIATKMPDNNPGDKGSKKYAF